MCVCVCPFENTRHPYITSRAFQQLAYPLAVFSQFRERNTIFSHFQVSFGVNSRNQMKQTEEPRESDACCSPEWLYGTASSAPRRTSLRLRRPNTPKKRLRVPAWTLKDGGRGRPEGPSVISAQTGMRREGGDWRK